MSFNKPHLDGAKFSKISPPVADPIIASILLVTDCFNLKASDVFLIYANSIGVR
jgi:hypothetical protein